MYIKKLLLIFLIFTVINSNYVAMAWLFQSAEEKLRVAEVMYDKRDRPIRAENLIYEARKIYEKQGDVVGVAHTYRAYAFLLKSKAVGRWSKMKFYDKTVNHDNRFHKAIDYLNKALKVYEEQNQHAYASNVYFNMAILYYEKLNNNEMACVFLDKSLISHEKYRKAFPEEKIEILNGYNNFQEVIKESKMRADCSD